MGCKRSCRLTWQLGLALFVAAGAVFTVRKGVDVRLVLIFAGLVMAVIAGVPWEVFNAFQDAVGKGSIIGPICTAMGYAYLLKATGADRAMVLALTKPLSSVKPLLIPGGVAIGVITNMAITSQTASAAALGPILIPVMIHAGYRPLTAAATLLIGCSVGGNLFNPGEPDIVTIHNATEVAVGAVMSQTVIPNLLAIVSATVVLMFVSRGTDDYKVDEVVSAGPSTDQPIRPILAFLPPLPVAILLVMQPGLNLFPSIFAVYPDGLHVSTVMLVCGAVVMLAGLKGASSIPARLSSLTQEFFAGMGFAFAKVISIILAAACFIGGLKALGVITALAGVFGTNHTLAALLSPLLTWTIAVIGGSGTAASVAFSQSMLPTLAKSDVGGAVDLGVAGAIGANVGRTMSPVAAVVLFTSALAEVEIADLVRVSAYSMLAALATVMVYGVIS